MKPITLLLLLLTIIAGCKSGNNAVAIRDFSKTLQPYLVKIVSTGIVSYAAEMSIKKHATDKELEQLSRSESPVLRAVALRNMLKRPSFNHYDVVMAHLDDTAIVFVDNGEWGIKDEMVSDDMLMNSMWKDTATKNKVISEIVLHHNYLGQAYFRSAYVSKDEKYYASILQMATRKRDEETFSTINYYVTEHALYSLAGYRKKEDIGLIKKILLENEWQIGSPSFNLMEEFPDTAYLEVFESYFPRSFYNRICRNGWTSSAKEFMQAIATYKCKRSAEILNAILNRHPFMPCKVDTSTLKWSLAHIINDNMCEDYKGMRTEVDKVLADEKRKTFSFTYNRDIDTTTYPKLAEPISW